MGERIDARDEGGDLARGGSGGRREGGGEEQDDGEERVAGAGYGIRYLRSDWMHGPRRPVARPLPGETDVEVMLTLP